MRAYTHTCIHAIQQKAEEKWTPPQKKNQGNASTRKLFFFREIMTSPYRRGSNASGHSHLFLKLVARVGMDHPGDARPVVV
jgi:hypothetical protein